MKCVLCVWLLSLSIVCFQVSYLYFIPFIADQYSIVWKDHILSILSTMNNAAVNICVHIFFLNMSF